MKKILLMAAIAAMSVTGAFAQSNLIKNGSFEEWNFSNGMPTNWERHMSSLVEESEDAQEGELSASLPLVSSYSNYVSYLVQQKVPFETGKTYTVSFYYKVIDGNVDEIKSSASYVPSGNFWPEEMFSEDFTTISQTGWNKIQFDYSATITTPADFYIYTYASAEATILIDNVVISEKGSSSIDTDKAPSFSVYPNPTSDILFVEGNNVEQLEVYGLNGTLLMRSKSSNQINISKLPAGVYTLIIKDGETITTQKVIKN